MSKEHPELLRAIHCQRMDHGVNRVAVVLNSDFVRVNLSFLYGKILRLWRLTGSLARNSYVDRFTQVCYADRISMAVYELESKAVAFYFR